MSSQFDVPASVPATPDEGGAGGGELISRDSHDEPETIAEARAEVVRSLDRIRWSFAVLKHEVQVRTDWKTYFRARPLAFLGTAFLVGFLFGSRKTRYVHIHRRR